jgi:hypothetical protein
MSGIEKLWHSGMCSSDTRPGIKKYDLLGEKNHTNGGETIIQRKGEEIQEDYYAEKEVINPPISSKWSLRRLGQENFPPRLTDSPEV